MSSVEYQEKVRWFKEARFGIYVHFGLYSVLGRGEWTMYSERINPAGYAKLVNDFIPDPNCVKEWVETAQAAGANYMVLTTRHHEGFCLFASQVSDFTSVKLGPNRDIVREFVDAARQANMRIGLYYSLLDWRFPGYFEPEKYPESYAALVDQAHAQVRELMSNYGKIDILEYDGAWDARFQRSRSDWSKFWCAGELNAMVRKLQPQIIINDRSGEDEDIETPEQVVRAGERQALTESCMCIGDSCGWGYMRFNPNWKSSEQLLQYLIQAAQLGGNYLLNIGPDSRGRIRNEELIRLQAIGRWLKIHGEAVYGAEHCDLIGAAEPGSVDLNLQGPWTRKGNVGYWCIFRWPGSEATAVKIATRPLRVTLLASSREYPFSWDPANGKLTIKNLPLLPPDELCSVLKVEFESIPRRMAEQDLAAWLF
ncbi:MAG: alpha-L-fucosidase [Lentisphaerae bacterium]|nr:alpha-L-fucosidase [Lentisphaerota bacterium]